ncbi:MAG: hypothetical protein JRJ78_13320 [Deltaproteobacteria bacterium]|nr:hypothetical protein [Deltaproteobacteria bacterium]
MLEPALMGRINVNIDKKLEEKFRRKVAERKGFKKGNLTDAVQEAMMMWINAPNLDEADDEDTQSKEDGKG